MKAEAKKRNGAGKSMIRAKKNSSKRSFSCFRPLLKAELRSYFVPYFITAIFLVLSLLLSLLLLSVKKTLPTVIYVFLYVAIIALAVSTVTIPSVRTLFDIKKAPIYKRDSLLGANAIPTDTEFTAVRFTAIGVYSLVTSLLYALAELSVTLLGGHYYDGYATGLISNAVFLFSLVFYLSEITVASVSDYDEKAPHPYRKCTLGGILLYTLGLSILVTVLLSVSGLSFGKQSGNETVLAPETLLFLSVIYFITSTLRSLYLFYITKKRLGRKLKLMKK